MTERFLRPNCMWTISGGPVCPSMFGQASDCRSNRQKSLSNLKTCRPCPFHTKGWTGAEFARFSALQPMEGIYFRFNAKKPGGEAAAIVPVAMDFCQSCQVGLNTPEAYERLLTDAIAGDSTYFTRWDEVSLAWEFVDRIVDAWKTMDDLHFYPAGSLGPEATKQLLEREGHHWWPVHGQHEGEIVWEMTANKSF